MAPYSSSRRKSLVLWDPRSSTMCQRCSSWDCTLGISGDEREAAEQTDFKVHHKCISILGGHTRAHDGAIRLQELHVQTKRGSATGTAAVPSSRVVLSQSILGVPAHRNVTPGSAHGVRCKLVNEAQVLSEPCGVVKSLAAPVARGNGTEPETPARMVPTPETTQRQAATSVGLE